MPQDEKRVCLHGDDGVLFRARFGGFDGVANRSYWLRVWLCCRFIQFCPYFVETSFDGAWESGIFVSRIYLERAVSAGVHWSICCGIVFCLPWRVFHFCGLYGSVEIPAVSSKDSLELVHACGDADLDSPDE